MMPTTPAPKLGKSVITLLGCTLLSGVTLPHCIPKLFKFDSSISAIMASTNTCAGRISNLEITDLSACINIGGAVIITALELGSAWILVKLVLVSFVLDAVPEEPDPE